MPTATLARKPNPVILREVAESSTASQTRPTLVMGIVNVTPDSFSDGGKYLASESAIAHGLQLFADGADLVDVGGESTRPGSVRVPVETELARVIPVVAALAAEGVPVSVDTMRAEVAAEAIEAGAVIINDVSGGLDDPKMAPLIAKNPDILFIAGHWRGAPSEMDKLANYEDVVADVVAELAERKNALLTQGISADQLILDPNLGFAKLGDQNWQLLAGMPALLELGQPILIGASRKRFLKQLVHPSVEEPGTGVSKPRIESATDLETATAAVSALAAAAGAWAVRVHDARQSKIAVEVAKRCCPTPMPQSSYAVAPSVEEPRSGVSKPREPQEILKVERSHSESLDRPKKVQV